MIDHSEPKRTLIPEGHPDHCVLCYQRWKKAREEKFKEVQARVAQRPSEPITCGDGYLCEHGYCSHTLASKP